MQSSKLAPFVVYYENTEEYHGLKNEIFTQGVYYFETPNAQPYIIDVGAHIGLSTLYFKKLFPGARVAAIEPQPDNFALMEKNIFENQLDDVSLYAVALSEHSGTAEFFQDSSHDKWYSTAGFHPGAWNGIQASRSIEVSTLPLSDFLTEPVEFLKMDIEGVEQSVLQSAAAQLHLIKHMIIEFHPVPTQSLAELMQFLRDHHFVLKCWKDGKEVIQKLPKGLCYIEATNSTQNRS